MDVKQFSSDKILGHLDRIKEWLDSGVSRPITYELDMTNICNHRCHYCFGFYGRDNQESLALGEAKRFIKQVKDFGARGITFTGGGEPLCNPATLEAVEFARAVGLDIGFITNGTLITEEVAQNLLRNCTWLRVSLDAASADVFKLTHGLNGVAYNAVIKNIALLVNKKIQINSSCSIGVGCLTFPGMKREILKFAKLCRDLKVDYAQYRPLLPAFSRGSVNYNTRLERGIVKEIERALKLSSCGCQVLYSMHKYDSLTSGERAKNYGQCYGHHFATVIAADKKMYLCCHFRGIEKYCLGDLTKNTLEEIWYSQRRKEVYENIDFRDCVLLCRCNTFNAILWNIKQEKAHPNFI